MVNNTDKEEKKAVKAAEKKARQDAKAAAKEEQKAKRAAVKKEKDAAKASRKGNMEEKNLSEDELDYQQPDHEKTVKLVKLNSTQMWSPVKDIKDGIVITKDGRISPCLTGRTPPSTSPCPSWATLTGSCSGTKAARAYEKLCPDSLQAPQNPLTAPPT